VGAFNIISKPFLQVGAFNIKQVGAFNIKHVSHSPNSLRIKNKV
jgi:hypothetical protein